MLDLIQETATGLTQAMKVYVLFNKTNGVFFGWFSYHEPHGFDENYFIVDVAENFNPETQDIKGVASDWQVVDKATQPQVMTEEVADKLTETEILDRYSVGKQLNNLSSAVVAIGEALGVGNLPEIEELREQVAQISLILAAGNLRKAGYELDDSYEYLTKEQMAIQDSLRYEGGLHELIGPQPV